MGVRSFEIAVAQGRVWACSACGGDREFVQPPCVDGHGQDGEECPEWACAECGAAVVRGIAHPSAAGVAGRAA